MVHNRRLLHRTALFAVLAPTIPAAVATSELRHEHQALQEARAAIAAGRFTAAEQVLRSVIADPSMPVVGEPAVLLETVRRTRLDYALTPGQMLAKLGPSIPDVTAEDVERWRREGRLQHRVIDGEIRYFRREPSNLFRFCPEARSRRAPRAPRPAGEFSLTRHLARLVTIAEAAKSAEVFPVRHRVSYRLAINAGHPRLRPGARVRCWLPFPQVYRQQKDVRLISSEPAHTLLARNGCPQRTIYFEQTVDDPASPPEFHAAFEFVTYAYCPALDDADARPYDQTSPLYIEYTAERPPHLVFTPRVRRIVAEAVRNEANPLRRARKLFRWVAENIAYCSEMEYSIIPNLSDKALATRRGDCGVQGMALIALCRAAGIPARWQSGWETLPGDWNMHDWVEFYVEPWGWLPADPSYGLKEHADPRVREFYFGHLDPYRMIVNLDYGRALHPPKISHRSEPNDFQRGEIEVDGHNLYFDEWDWTFEVQTTPLTEGFAALEEALDAALPRLLHEDRIPGAVIAVGRKTAAGYETWQKAYGFARIEPERRPMPADAIFDLASLTKPIATGTSLMLLAERGLVRLDHPVGRYLPEFNQGDKRRITVRNLMTHTSGIKPYLDRREQETLRQNEGLPCPQALRAYVRALEPVSQPGETVAYSCLNAILCAEIVETVSGQPLDRFASENLFEPLGMRDTGFHLPENLRARCLPTTRAGGDGGFLQGQVHDPLAAMQGGVSGNAGLFSSVADLHRYAQMLLNGGSLNGTRVLAPETVARMIGGQDPAAGDQTERSHRRGLLWDLYGPRAPDSAADGLRAFGHTGYTGAAMRFYPDKGVYAMAMANRVHPQDQGKVERLRRAVWRLLGQTVIGVTGETTAALKRETRRGP
jgi:CubicO group peptidase (beta-lactamase class C family)/transglutaminase-like putative cysteine protease